MVNVYIYILTLDPLFYFRTGKLLIDKPTAHPNLLYRVRVYPENFQFLQLIKLLKVFVWAATSF